MTTRRRPDLRRLTSVPTRRPGTAAPALDLEGIDLDGARRCVRVTGSDHRWLLLFLGAKCDACGPFFAAVAHPEQLALEAGDRVAIVTRPPPHEDPCVLRELVPAGVGRVPLVQSDSVWDHYGVHGPPFFALVDQSQVVTEGVAWSVEQVAMDVARARRTVTPPAGRQTDRSD